MWGSLEPLALLPVPQPDLPPCHRDVIAPAVAFEAEELAGIAGPAIDLDGVAAGVDPQLISKERVGPAFGFARRSATTGEARVVPEMRSASVRGTVRRCWSARTCFDAPTIPPDRHLRATHKPASAPPLRPTRRRARAEALLRRVGPVRSPR
jgi:hypothetical protein